jgi:hypothetical protein
VEEDEFIGELIDAGATDDEIVDALKEFRANKQPKQEDSRGFWQKLGSNAQGLMSGIDQGIAQTVAAPFKFEGDVEQGLGFRNPIQYAVDGNADQTPWATRLGNLIESGAQATDPNANETVQQVGQGLGQAASTALTMGSTAAPEVLGATATRAPGAIGWLKNVWNKAGEAITNPGTILGGMQSAVPEFDAAKAAGATDEQAFDTLVENYVVGQTEALPIGDFLKRLNTATGGVMARAVKSGGVGAMEEAAQEALQQYLSNQIAKENYDPDRDPMLDVLNSATVGGIVGFILPSVGHIARSAPAPTRVKLEQKVAEARSNAAIANTSTGVPTIDAEIDHNADFTPAEKQQITAENIRVAEEEDADEAEALAADAERAADLEAKLVDLKNKKSDKEATKADKEKIDADITAAQLKLDNLNGAEEAVTDLQYSLNDALDQKMRVKDKEGNKGFFKKDEGGKLTFENKDSIVELGNHADMANTNLKELGYEPAPVQPREKVEKVLVNPKQILREDMQRAAKEVEKGVKKGQKITNEQIIKRLQNTMKEANLSPKQINAALTKGRGTNFFTPGSFSRFQTFLDRIVEDADYADNLSTAQQINKQIRKAVRGESVPQNYKNVATRFSKIPVTETMIQQHLKLGQDILRAVKGQTTKGPTSFNVDEATQYVDRVSAEAAENYKAQEKSTESYSDKDTPDQERQHRFAAEFAQQNLNEKDISDFSKDDQDVINNLKAVDLSTISDVGTLRNFARVADNIVENDDLSNTGDINAYIAGDKSLDELLDMDFKQKLWKVRGVGRTFGNIPQQLTQVTGDSGYAAEIFNKIGGQEAADASSKVEIAEHRVENEVEDVVRRIKKEDKTDINDLDNQAIFVALSEMVKNYGNDNHIGRVKSNVDRSIKLYEEDGRTAEANAWKKAKEVIAPANSVAEAMHILQTEQKGVYKLWQYFNNLYGAEILPGLQKLTQDVENTPFDEADNYMHTEYERIDRSTQEIMPKESPAPNSIVVTNPNSAKTATRAMPPGYAYSTDGINSQLQNYRETLYRIEANRALLKMREVMKNPKFKEVVGGKANADLIHDMLIRMSEVQGRMSTSKSNDFMKLFFEVTRTMKFLSAVKALGNVAAPLKQVPSVMTRTLFNHVGTNSVPDFIRGVTSLNLLGPNKGLKKLFDQHTIGARGLQLGGTERGEALQRRMVGRGAKRLARIADKLGKGREKLSTITLKPLIMSDVYAARASWLGYYLQSLRESGIKNVDLTKEWEMASDPARKKASAFAEQKIAETQSPSNPSLLSQAVRNDNNQSFNVIKNVVLPFSNFTVGSKYRHIQDFTNLLRNPNQKTAAAVGGDLAEIALYAAAVQGVIVGIWRPYLKTIIENVTGVEPPEVDDEEVQKKKDLQLKDMVIKQAFPLAVGTGGEWLTSKIFNGLARQMADPDMTYEEWKKEGGGYWYNTAPMYDAKEALDFGLYGLGIEPAMELANDYKDLSNVAEGDPVEVEGAMGKTSEAELDTNQERILVLKTFFDMMMIGGINESDVYNQISKIYKEQKKEAAKPQRKTVSY